MAAAPHRLLIGRLLAARSLADHGLHLLLRLGRQLCETHTDPRRVLHELLAAPLHALQGRHHSSVTYTAAWKAFYGVTRPQVVEQTCGCILYVFMHMW